MDSANKIASPINKFEEFFSTKYKEELFQTLERYPEERSLIVRYLDLEMYDPSLADALIEKPDDILHASEQAIKNVDPSMRGADLNIRFEDLSNIIPLKLLLSKYIGKFVSVDGIVRKTDEIRPRIETGVYECRSCMRTFPTSASSGNNVNPPAICPECGGRSFKLLENESTYIDTQTARIQEPLENLSGGTEPKQILITLEDDLVDTVNPGDSIRVTGTLKTFKDEKSQKYKNYIYVNYIQQLEQEFEELDLSEEDIEKIIELSQDEHIYEKILNSTAPAIKGQREVKEAVALQLFGGSPKILEDKTHLRGDIHVLIIGDPGMGKSQILKYVSKLAPRSIYTSGQGTTGAGLTAAAVRDELGGWSLEAGALVLGDKGNVCVDELDKMRKEDRSGLHEALEQQTISIAKAGIMATLNSRCSVLAAANPKFGRFDKFKPTGEQVDLPPTILSRFDLTFLLEDKPNVEKDRELASHILKTHKSFSIEYAIEPELLRKYISYARSNVHPVLSDEAIEVIQEFYVATRNANVGEDAAVPITARYLEALVRLAESSAKLKLSDKVSGEDAKLATKLQRHVLETMGMDSETGEFDADLAEGRPAKSKRDKLNRVAEEIKELQQEYNGQAPVNVLKDNLKEKYNISEENADMFIKDLRNQGVIIQPKTGYLKYV
ncbi:minichromosome maintenance protein MCM [Methanobrevibacter curvatus]|uniref:DNA helicase n=1 Tax=Methanobrevibacter curvatus TaxID=49547 RepID=A0A166CAI0_9EURY|nr:minichromosome maintenance protein MCM [Methanobrevibacter curvatus]KZX14301.1 MCM2/3/5 family protein [Methanobrevibacter curvatus]